MITTRGCDRMKSGRACSNKSTQQGDEATERRLLSFGIVLLFCFAGPIFFLFRSGKGFLQADHIFAGFQSVERLGLASQLLFRVVRRLDRKTDSSFDFVDFNDSSFDFLADFKNIFDLGDMILAQLRDVNQAIDIVLQLDESAEARELSYLTVDQVANFVFLIDVFPWILGQLLNSETDPLVDLVDVNNDGFDFIVLLKYFARMIDLSGPA